MCVGVCVRVCVCVIEGVWDLWVVGMSFRGYVKGIHTVITVITILA